MMVHYLANIGAKSRVLPVFLATALTACSGREAPKVDENPFPSDYKKEIINFMPSVVANPINIRGAFVSEPALTPFGAASRYTVCVRFDPISSGRKYAGSQDRIAIFHAGQLNQFIPASREQCGNAAYKPFPELEKICFATKCN
jgi:hypothetical protein